MITRTKVDISLRAQTDNNRGPRSHGEKHRKYSIVPTARKDKHRSQIRNRKGSAHLLKKFRWLKSYCLVLTRGTPKIRDPERLKSKGLGNDVPGKYKCYKADYSIDV